MIIFESNALNESKSFGQSFMRMKSKRRMVKQKNVYRAQQRPPILWMILPWFTHFQQSEASLIENNLRQIN